MELFWTHHTSLEGEARFRLILISSGTHFLHELVLISTFLWIFLGIMNNLGALSKESEGRAAVILSSIRPLS